MKPRLINNADGSKEDKNNFNTEIIANKGLTDKTHNFTEKTEFCVTKMLCFQLRGVN